MYAELKRICKTCDLEKPVSEFTSSGNSPSARSRAKNHCHQCQKDVGNARAAINRKANPEKIRDSKLRSLYGISLKDYEEKLTNQGHVCSICKRAQSRKNGVTGKQENLVVDHNHATKQVRDLLCHKCNMDVGIVEKRLPLILDYLEKFKKAG